MYLELFTLPDLQQEEWIIETRKAENGGIYGYIDNPYPCGLFPDKELRELSFDRITILYGGNGSGKSTLLNLIAQKLELNRIAPFNTSETFGLYVEKCDYVLGYDDEGFRHRIPDGSRIITSDDIFDYMLMLRSNNEEIAEEKERGKEIYRELRYGSTLKFSGLDDYEAFREQVLARKKTMTRRQFVKRTAGEEVKPNSNGETALKYFEQKLRFDRLYCLDEPENSMSPKMQTELKRMLEEYARYCGCQFIIATHSPFLLSMEGARIYDLDADPVGVRNWWELENVRICYDFFREHGNLFRMNK